MKAKNGISKVDEQLRADKPLAKSTNQFPVVGIGASAGGLDAFKKLLKAIPEDSGMAYVLVQHLDPKHESLLPELLQKATNIPVMEISDDLRVEPNHIYIIPSNKMMIANDGVLLLSPRPPKDRNQRNLPIDLFFISLAEVHQSHAIGVVLSGTASDGTLGLKAIKDHGGITFAQDEESAAYEGMPHSAAQAGVVDFILPPQEIPQKLMEVIGKVNLSDDELQNIPLQEEDVYKQMLTLLRLRKGTDFTYYKQTTIRRRILRRMAINKNEDHAAYLKFLRENKTEQDILYQDLLIPVTDFFRDPKVFDELCKTIFPKIIENKTGSEPIRIWVAGCSTGEEVYSMAICLKELLNDVSANSGFGTESYQRVQIFATDISEPAIAKARAGVYSKADVKGLTEKQLKDYFTKTTGIYQANKAIRDICVFAVHNFLKDPPFSKIDFISCRNVLIYMEPYLQKKAFTTFHYALNANGFLLLGKSESTGGVPNLFAAFNKKEKIFTRKDVPGSFIHTATHRSEASFTDVTIKAKRENIRNDFQKTADDIMLSKYTPAGVVVNEAMDIVHFRGSTGNYLEPQPGKASLNLLKMAKEGLAFELRSILHKAKKENQAVVKENIPVQINDALKNISIEAIPLPNMAEPHYLVLFHDGNTIGNKQLATGKKSSTKSSKLTPHDSQLTDQLLRIKHLELELAQVRDDMRSITEDQETVNEELQSANEELLSSSEELQSLNEEMETSKEELQSSNEELTVVNQEMIGLNEQVIEARDYAQSIVATVHEPLLILNKSLRIKSANDSFYKTFQVNERDTEDRLIFDLGNRQWNIPGLKNLLEDILTYKTKFENFEVTHNFPNIGERTMLLNAREMNHGKEDEKLILLAIEDITQQKEVEKFLIKSTNHFRHMVKELPAVVYSCDAKGILNFYNNAALKMWGRKPQVGKEYWCGAYKLANFDNTPLPVECSFMALAIKEGHATHGAEIIVERPDGTRSHVRVYAMPEFDASGKVTGATNMEFDITEQVHARERVAASETFSRSVINSSPDCIKILDAEGRLQFMNLNGICLMEIDDFALVKNKYWWDLWERENKQMLQDAVTKAFNGERVQFQALGKTAKGTPKWWDVIVLPIAGINKNDKVEQLISVSRDITASKEASLKLQESEHRFANMVYSSPSLISILKGEDLIIEIANDAILESWGKGKDIIGKPLLQVMPEIVEQGFGEIFKNVYTTGITFQANEMPAYVMRNKKLELSYYTFSYQALRNIKNEVEGISIISYEVTPEAILNINLKESEERFRSLADNVPMHIFIVEPNAEASISYWNKNWLNYTGQTMEEAVGRAWDGIIHPDDVGPIMDVYMPAFEKQQPYSLPAIRIKRHDGVYRWFQVQANPRYLPNGEFMGYIGVGFDIHESKLAENAIKESEVRFKQMAELMPQKIWASDAEGNKNYFNKTLLDYAGKSFEELKGAGWQKIIHPDDWGKNKKQWEESISTGKDYETENRLLREDGKYLWHLTRAVCLKDKEGKITMWLGSKTEIQQIKEEEERQGDFIKMVSHELKTPVTSIKGYVQTLLMILEEEDAKISPVVMKSSLVRIDKQIVKLTRLIYEMLDLTRIEAGSLELKMEPFSLNNLIKETAADIETSQPKYNIKIYHDFKAAVFADRDRIGQVLINFINNAIKYSPQSNSIEIRIYKTDTGKVSVSVKDFGIGINKEEQQKIFERFYRVGGKNEQTFPGFGIGLFIANSIIQKHDGIISINSTKGIGSEFIFTLNTVPENNL